LFADAGGEAGDAAVVVDVQFGGLAVVLDLDAFLQRHVEEGVGEALAAADRLGDEAAPEAEFVADAVGLASVEEHPAEALLAHPEDGRVRLRDERLGEVGVGEALGDAHQVIVELGLRVGADVDAGALFVGHFGDEGTDVVDAAIGEAEAAAGEEGVAAAEVLRRFFEDEDIGALLAGGEGGAEGGVAGADDDDIGGGRGGHDLPPGNPSPRPPPPADARRGGA
jgi:hypothetical protein